MITVRAVLLSGVLGMASTLTLAGGDRPITGGAPVGATGGAPVGATGRLPTGSFTPVSNGSYGRGRGGSYSNGFVFSNHGGSFAHGNTNRGHSYGAPRDRYGAVAPFFFGLPYDAGAYYGPVDSGYNDGPGPAPNDPLIQQMQMEQNMLGDEIRHLNAKFDELEGQTQAGRNPPPPPYLASPESQSGAQPESAAPPATPPTPPVIVVLRNGQRFESNSYAVMNETFWDFSKTPARRVSMVDVDVPASIVATEKTGAEFPE